MALPCHGITCHGIACYGIKCPTYSLKKSAARYIQMLASNNSFLQSNLIRKYITRETHLM